MLKLPNTIGTEELGKLIGINRNAVGAYIKKGQIVAFIGGSDKQAVYTIPRRAFYKKMGWETDDEIICAYEVAGIELPIIENKSRCSNSD